MTERQHDVICFRADGVVERRNIGCDPAAAYYVVRDYEPISLSASALWAPLDYIERVFTIHRIVMPPEWQGPLLSGWWEYLPPEFAPRGESGWRMMQVLVEGDSLAARAFMERFE